MTDSQRILDKFLDAVLSIQDPVNPNYEMLIARKLRRYPFASVVYTEFRDGEVFILKADDRIEGITGYKPEELAGKPLTFIMFKPFEPKTLAKTMDELVKYGASLKTNLNKKKDGTSVETFGVLEDMGKNLYREVVVDASKIIGHEVRKP